MRILSSFSHEHIIKYHCSFQVKWLLWITGGGGRSGSHLHPHHCSQSEGKLNIVMEYASRGNVERAIQERQKPENRAPFAELTVINWLRQLGGALQHMHTKEILHRDLKAHNLVQ